MNIRTILTAILAGTLLVVLGATSVSYPSTVNAKDRSKEYCVAMLEPAGYNADGIMESKVSYSKCFDGMQDLVAFVTAGRVQLSANVTQQEADELLHQDASVNSVYILQQIWEHQNYVGATAYLYYSVDGCAVYGNVGVPDVAAQWGGNWQNRISSIKHFSSCNKARLYEYAFWNQGHPEGATAWCYGNCAALGAMDNHVRSMVLYP